MKFLFKKSLAVLLSAILLLTAIPFAASAATVDEAEQSVGASSGTTGDCTWTLDDNGTLTISGNGAMGDYYYNYSDDTFITTAPWGTNIKTVVIEDGVTSIGDYTFLGCTGLTSVIIPDSVTSIAVDAFYNTAWYNNQPNGLVYAGKVAYKYKGTITSNISIVIQDGTLGIADNACECCYGLTSITIPESVISIGGFAFHECYILTSVTIPNSVTSIGYYAFKDCTGLTSVTIGNSVTSIGSCAFRGCTGLKSVTIPSSVTSIGDYEFYGCTRLDKRHYPRQRDKH